MKSILKFIFLVTISTNTVLSQSYKNAKLPISTRVDDLISKMTLEEKVAQISSIWSADKVFPDENFLKDTLFMKKSRNGIGFVQSLPFDVKPVRDVKIKNAVQKYLIEKSRLGIPAVFVDECLHGLVKDGATSFPQAIGMASSWDTAMVRKVFDQIGREIRSRGSQHTLGPVVDVARDPRWGRTEETYGEDPYLNGMLGSYAVAGLQGGFDGSIGSQYVGATLKHFAGHGQSEAGINKAPVDFAERLLRDVHIKPFKMSIDMAKPSSVMPSYNSLDGVPSHMNTWLLKEVLRKDLKFEGMVSSDYAGIDEMFTIHNVSKSREDAAIKSILAGVDSDLPTSDNYFYLIKAVKEGKLDIAPIDAAVRKILEFKFKVGVFEKPYIDLKEINSVLDNPVNKTLPYEAAAKSIVLLKNDGILPLHFSKYKKIALIGPNAFVTPLGEYSGTPKYKVSVYEALKAKTKGLTEIVTAAGCAITTNYPSNSFVAWNKVYPQNFASPAENKKMIDEAVKVAKDADLVLLFVGENEHLTREVWSKEHLGDHHNMALCCGQEELAAALLLTGKPVVAGLLNGRPLTINTLDNGAKAILECWYAGQESGNVIVDILMGKINPSGKLTITFPKHEGQLPMYYARKPSSHFHRYVFMDTLALYPFGHGLSYSTFKYSDYKLSTNTMIGNDKIKVSVKVTNESKISGDEIVQLYMHDKISSVERPIRELIDFARINLKPGETKEVVFSVDKSKLAFTKLDKTYGSEPGDFDFMIGRSSQDLKFVGMVNLLD